MILQANSSRQAAEAEAARKRAEESVQDRERNIQDLQRKIDDQEAQRARMQEALEEAIMKCEDAGKCDD